MTRFLLYSVLSLLFLGYISALTFDVDANSEECFFEDVPKNIKVGGSYQVSKGGQLDIDVKITGPDTEVVYIAEKEKEGKFSFNADLEGTYRFCFSNKMSAYTSKSVTFYVTVGDIFEADQIAKQEHLTPLENSIVNLSEGLAAIQSEQKYMRMRERVHRTTSEKTNSRVLWFSLLEATVLIVVSLMQVYYLRRFFEVKRVV